MWQRSMRSCVMASFVVAVGCAKADGDGGGSGGLFGDLGWNGTWHSECVAEEEDFGQARLHFDGTSASRTFAWYATPACRDGDEYVTYGSAFHDARQLEPADLDGYTTIKATVTSHVATPKTAGQATYWNEKKRFGYDDWEAHVAKDIAGRKWDESDEYPYSTAGAEIYRTLALEDGKLVFAAYENGVALRSDDPLDAFTRD